MNNKILTPLARYLISEFDKSEPDTEGDKISVDQVVSEVATWYEKLRNAMDYREDDVILRAAIERILKRRLLLGGNGATIAKPLVRELIWARYFPDGSVSESKIALVEQKMNLYFQLQDKIIQKHKVAQRHNLSEWILHLLSSELEHLLNPNREKELISNFMFQIFKDRLTITDDTEETRDVQIFLAIRRTFAKEDLPLLRYQLFIKLFGHLTEGNIEKISDHFLTAQKQIEYQLNYSLKDKIYTYIKKQTIPFFIFEDVLKAHQGENSYLFSDEEKLKLAIFNACAHRYKNIQAKVNRAIVRGVIFILITKAIFALAVEGSFESMVYGHVLWNSIALNTLIPPLLMVIVGLMIKTPGKENSAKILERINSILYEPKPQTIYSQTLRKSANKIDPVLNSIFIVLWLLAFVLSFGSLIFVLSKLQFNAISQGVFIFFITIVSFISYRISQTARMYTISDGKHSLKSVLFDFFFIPFIDLGRNLTENISRINVIILVFDLLIEAPFKVLFSFFEEWFLFLRSQREKLG